VRADDVIVVLDMLDRAGVRHWVGGGWGVAALVGRQTREHRDLDLAVDVEDLERSWQVLGQLGYAAETDWLPVRMELRASGGRWVDVHPVHFDEDGHGRQPDLDGGHFDYPPAAFTTGSIGGHLVPCLSAQQQRRFRTGMSIASKTSMIWPSSMRSMRSQTSSHRHDTGSSTGRFNPAVARAEHWRTRPGPAPSGQLG
jgi:lincosamide nucleotidyltransferase A/C/D/E